MRWDSSASGRRKPGANPASVVQSGVLAAGGKNGTTGTGERADSPALPPLAARQGEIGRIRGGPKPGGGHRLGFPATVI